MFQLAEAALLAGRSPVVAGDVGAASDTMFQCGTQAYREALLGCAIVRIQSHDVDLRLPYVKLGDNAYGGRTLDERVINPFLQSRRIPCSKGPYLSVFRRSVSFYPATGGGVRDKAGYDTFLVALSHLECLNSEQAVEFLLYQLYGFAELREAANIPLSTLHRISLEQYDQLLTGLLATPSGGLFPVVLAVALLKTIRVFFGLGWDITTQGINVADAASGAGADITVSDGDSVVLAIEVTERSVDQSRVVSTFNTKIAPNGIEDYLFFVGRAGAKPDAKRQAQHYFAQGHEVNFVNIKEWILVSLATVGRHGRETFNREILAMMEEHNVPKALRVAWNEPISALVAI